MFEKEHYHWFAGSTSYENGHTHKFSGHTKKFVELHNNHCHRIFVVIEADGDHDHIIEIMTGPGIYNEHGHYHYYIGETSLNGRPQHNHSFDKITSPPIGYYY